MRAIRAAMALAVVLALSATISAVVLATPQNQPNEAARPMRGNLGCDAAVNGAREGEPLAARIERLRLALKLSESEVFVNKAHTRKARK